MCDQHTTNWGCLQPCKKYFFLVWGDAGLRRASAGPGPRARVLRGIFPPLMLSQSGSNGGVAPARSAPSIIINNNAAKRGKFVCHFRATGEQTLGCGPGGGGHQLRSGGGVVCCSAGAVGLRQIDHAAPDCRAGIGFLRPGTDRRYRCNRDAAVEAPHFHGVPVLCAVSAPVGGGKHPVRTEGAQSRSRRTAPAPRENGRNAGPRAVARTQTVTTFRRSAAARRPRARHHR